MKVAIIYYSFSGNTKKASLFLMRKLNTKGIEGDLIELKPKNEEPSFIKQGSQAFFKKTPELVDVDYALGKYDFIVFASPIWAFTFVPALRTYLQKINNLEDKKAGCFLTHGSGLGKAKALKELEKILREKGARILFSKDFPGSQTKDDSFLEEQFKPLLDIIGA